MADVRRLAVLLSGAHVADVERTRAGVVRLTFTATGGQPGTTPLSLSLPKEVGTHSGNAVEYWLRALLPDNDAALRAAADTHGVDARDPIALLSAIGKDCAGAVQFCLPDQIEATRARTGQLVAISDSDIEARLDEMDTNEEASWTMAAEHWSLGGTQQKFALRRQGDRWFTTTGSEPTTHIVKPGIRKLKAQALAEHVSMTAARALGLPAAATTYESFKSQDAVVIERFDRLIRGDSVARLHQEDMCQVLGRWQKYEEFGGPSALDVATALRDFAPTAASGERDVAVFVDDLIYNTVIGAPDAHARNYSVRLDGESVHLAPLYDVATGLGYGTRTDVERKLSMSVGGQFVLDRIDAEAFKRLAGSLRVDEGRVLDRVTYIADSVTDHVVAALDDVDDWDGSATALRDRLVPALGEHAARVARAASNPRPRSTSNASATGRRAKTTPAGTAGSFAPRRDDEQDSELSD
ncbi:HipA domain-containing protein [Xylanimonas sp. McL0601]|uniref:HipA domain-containing protein n=1 Tax=Xylanimonas sp. McL0601 TaxID=3414739 RepID=UPI003CF44836